MRSPPADETTPDAAVHVSSRAERHRDLRAVGRPARVVFIERMARQLSRTSFEQATSPTTSQPVSVAMRSDKIRDDAFHRATSAAVRSWPSRWRVSWRAFSPCGIGHEHMPLFAPASDESDTLAIGGPNDVSLVRASSRCDRTAGGVVGRDHPHGLLSERRQAEGKGPPSGARAKSAMTGVFRMCGMVRSSTGSIIS